MDRGKEKILTKLYFAYGSNLWLEQMSSRCPNHRVVCNAILKGYHWIISERGYANVCLSWKSRWKWLCI